MSAEGRILPAQSLRQLVGEGTLQGLPGLGACPMGLLGSREGFYHNAIPLAFKACARAWTAREQCVLTLPSEHPMA
jgi:hypothetical protein